MGGSVRERGLVKFWLLPASGLGIGLITVCPAWGLPLEPQGRSPDPPPTQPLATPASTQASHLLPAADTAVASSPTSVPAAAPPTATPDAPLDLDPKLIQSSPVLQRWLKQVPNVLDEIRHDPSFRTRLRLGYSQFPSTNHASGWNVGVEDVFLGRSGLTLNADYQGAFNGKREAWGADLRYYVLPLGSFINAGPVLGFRHLETTRYETEGLNAGFRVLLVPSRTGAADISLTQTWVAPGSDREVGLTTLSFGYALTSQLRLSTDIQKQNSRQRKDSRVGIVLEWMLK